MDHRLHERLPADIEAHLINLSRQEGEGRCWILDASKSGVAVLTGLECVCGDVVRLEIPEGGVYGHVIYVTAEDGISRVGIEVEQVLLGRSDIGCLVDRLAQEVVRVPENAAQGD